MNAQEACNYHNYDDDAYDVEDVHCGSSIETCASNMNALHRQVTPSPEIMFRTVSGRSAMASPQPAKERIAPVSEHHQ